MKRDMDLLRRLLSSIESSDVKPSWRELTNGLDEQETNRVLKHLDLLHEAELIRGLRVWLHGYALWQDLELTFAGHEVLEAVRGDKEWNAIKEKVASFSLHGLKEAIVSARASSAARHSSQIFLVHGHDDGMRETVARFLERTGFEVVILHERANRGRTIIEKFETNSDVGFAVVLLSPDDVGGGAPDKLTKRARQNVILELGYFIGRLGRERVCTLKRGDVELPSDILGIVWEDFDSGGAWKQRLAGELKAAGYTIDWNKVMSS